MSMHNCFLRSETVYVLERMLLFVCFWRDSLKWATDSSYIHAPGGVRTHNLSRRAAADLRLRPHGHWERRTDVIRVIKCGRMIWLKYVLHVGYMINK